MSQRFSIYLASSWRNLEQPGLVRVLRDLGHDCYDFRNPKDDDTGFSWGEIDLNYPSWSAEQFIEALLSEEAGRGFANDWAAMRRSQIGVLLLPSGRSAHIEAGYFVGAGKPLHIVLPENGPMVPELMYKMADKIHPNISSLVKALT